MSNIASGRKRKTFPALDAPGPGLDLERPVIITSESEDSEDESDASEAVTLTNGRTAAAARSSAIQNHRKRLIEKKKAQNKTREAFIQSAKSKALGTVPTLQELPHPIEEDSSKSGSDSDETDKGPSELEGDPKLLARMQTAMQNALDEDEDEADGESSNEGAIGASTGVTPSARLPDSVFAAAAQGQQKPERKRQKVGQERDAKSKRRRVRESPAERIVGGRTVRVVNSLNAPLPPLFKASRKTSAGVKGGKAFRQKWKRRDALQAQVRSRAGPAQKFATTS
ncbi:hypothetical protein FRC09_018571 [Ceratobasidium sp. 395]|nr:hypothetical protein FRC09_018571 [Ceratobasidium sp. 395]